MALNSEHKEDTIPKLSIIIPCFNCKETLEEALASVYQQELSIPFEVVMVDDGSTDGTKDLITNLAKKYPYARCFFHEKNRGGGAARNTAVRNSLSEVIFCLDSDDILPPDTLSRMYNFLKEKDCDAVGINRSIKFNGSNPKDVAAVHIFGYAGEHVPFKSLIEKEGVAMNPLYSTFMHTRKAFDIAGGYAENHGFDTQSFAWRFLANGFVAYTCPNAEYLHRINFYKSYYVREAESGRVNLNWFKIFDEFLFLFNERGQRQVLSFMFNDYTKNIYDSLKKIEPLFVDNLSSYTTQHCKDAYMNKVELKPTAERTIFDLYWLGSELLRRKNFSRAKEILLNAKEKGFSYPIIEEKLFLCEQCIAGKDLDEEQKKIDTKKQKLLPLWKKCLKMTRDFLRSIKKTIYYARVHIKARIRNKRFIFLFVHLLALRIKRALKLNFAVTGFDKGPVDIVIITASKDHALLETYLTYLKKNLCQDINKIFLVSLENQEVRDFCSAHKITFINERTVLGYDKNTINYRVNGIDRNGWIFQQLLKLSGERFVEMENYIIVDSDTLLINKHTFLKHGKFIFFENEEWNESYFKAFKKMFGYSTKNKLSFTSHMMIFNTKNLVEMKSELEKKHGVSWDKVYLSTVNEHDMSCVSDYDTYANWVLCNHPENITTEPLYNIALGRSKLTHFDTIVEDLKRKHKSVSFHSYIKN